MEDTLAVLDGPWRRRLPHRRRAQPGQGRRPSRRRCRARDGRREHLRPPDVGPAGGARRLPPLAEGDRLLRRRGAGCRPDHVRRGVGDADRGDGALRPTRRAAPDVQLRLPDEPVDRLGAGGQHRRVAQGRRAAQRDPDLGPVQPRRRPARLAPRLRPGARTAADAGDRRRRPAARRRGRPEPGPRRDHGDARAAGVVLPLPGRGAGPARRDRAARRGPAGPGLDEVRARLTGP